MSSGSAGPAAPQRLATGSNSRLPTGERLATGSSERLATGSSSTTSSSRPLTNATPTLPPIVEHYGFASGYAEDPKHTGVRKTSSDISRKLGYYTAPGEPRLIGSFGYTSPSYTDLRPAQGARVATKPHGPTAAGVSLRPLKGGSAGSAGSAGTGGYGGRSLITERDVEFLRERDADNQQIYEVWSQRKQLELQLEKEEADRRRAESDARYEAREQANSEVNNTALKQWTSKKVKQQKADAEDSYIRQIKQKALAVYHQRINHAYETKCKRREQGFALRTDAAVLPPSFDGYTRGPGGLGPEPSSKSQGGKPGAPGREKSSATYKSMLEEADRAGDEEATVVALMGGLHPVLVAAGRRAVSETHPPGVTSSGGGGGVGAEPSFASAARRGSGSRAGSPTTLPPLPHHLVPATLVAHYLPAQGSQVSLGGNSGSGVAQEPSGSVGLGGNGVAASSGSSRSSSMPHAVMPPNITSVYAPRSMLGAIAPDEGDAEDEEERSAAGATGAADGSDAGPTLHASAGLLAAYGSPANGGYSAEAGPDAGSVSEASQQERTADASPAPASRTESMDSYSIVPASRQESMAAGSAAAASLQESMPAAGSAPASRAESMAAGSIAAASRQESTAAGSVAAATRQESLTADGASSIAAVSRRESLRAVGPAPASRAESMVAGSVTAASRQESLTADGAITVSRQESLTDAGPAPASRAESFIAGGASSIAAASRQESIATGGVAATSRQESMAATGPAPLSRTASMTAAGPASASRQESMTEGSVAAASRQESMAAAGPAPASRAESMVAAGPAPASRAESMEAAGPAPASRAESMAAAGLAPASRAESMVAAGPSPASRAESMAAAGPAPASRAESMEAASPAPAFRAESMAAGAAGSVAEASRQESLARTASGVSSSPWQGAEPSFAPSFAPSLAGSVAAPPAGQDLEVAEAPGTADLEGDAGAEAAGYDGVAELDDDDLGPEAPLPKWDDDSDADDVLAAVAAAQGQGL